MIAPDKAFSIASDEFLADLILKAHRRLVVIAPALTDKVADAVVQRLRDLGKIEIKVILDSDPEVYRLGYGDEAALKKIQEASSNSLFDLREQAGVRIGVVISDDTVMVFSPVPRNIEAGSTCIEKPNAIILAGEATNRIAIAAGAHIGEYESNVELGKLALEPASVEKIQANLKENPPIAVDISQTLRVFSSEVQYVEFSVSNYRLATKQIPLPSELVNVRDENLKNLINSRIRGPFDKIKKVKIRTKNEKGEDVEKEVDDVWLHDQRKRIENLYTFQVNRFGRLIFRSDKEKFEKETKAFEGDIRKYQESLRNQLADEQKSFVDQITNEFFDAWRKDPPEYFKRWNEVNDENIKMELEKRAVELFEDAISFAPPVLKTVYKDVSAQNIRDCEFLETLRKIMMKKRVPEEKINSLFKSGIAAPETTNSRNA